MKNTFDSKIIKFEYELEKLADISDKIFRFIYNQKKIVLFYGNMGAGKTTLIRNIIKSSNEILNPKSPTYNYIFEYEIFNGFYIWHFDLFMIKDENEFYRLNMDEYFDRTDGICFIEWPEKISNLINNYDTISIYLGFLSENKREIKII